MYAGPLADKSTVVLLFNRATSSASITATWDGIILSSFSLYLLLYFFILIYDLCDRGKERKTYTNVILDIGLPANTKAQVRDLWLHQDLGSYLIYSSFLFCFVPSPLRSSSSLLPPVFVHHYLTAKDSRMNSMPPWNLMEL